MAKYRKRPIVIEATQWWPGRPIGGVFFTEDYEVEDQDGVRRVQSGAFVVSIHDQRVFLQPGDWIITEPDGVYHYPCKPDIFAASYDYVGD